MHGTRWASAVLATTIVVGAGACKKTEPRSEPAASSAAEPDAPKAFGSRCVWLAFKGASPAAVVSALGLHEVAPSPWRAGLAGAYAGRVFVTPPLTDAGWVLAASTRFPDPGDRKHPDDATPLLERLSRALGEVQYFGTDADVGWQAWARYVNGAPARKLAYLGADNLVIWADGTITREEHELGLAYTKEGLREPPFPSEANVFQVAGAWSVDPSTLEARHLPPSVGTLGAL